MDEKNGREGGTRRVDEKGGRKGGVKDERGTKGMNVKSGPEQSSGYCFTHIQYMRFNGSLLHICLKQASPTGQVR